MDVVIIGGPMWLTRLLVCVWMTFGSTFGHAGVFEDVEAYLEGLKSAEARFVQVDPYGRVTGGILILDRPGNILFEFEDPSPLKIASDGVFVVVYDKISKELQRFPLSATPLNLLLQDDVDLRGSGAVKLIEQSKDFVRLHLEDPEGKVPGSLMLIFEKNPMALKRWITTDAQGQKTTVILENMKQGGNYPRRLFVITDEIGN